MAFSWLKQNGHKKTAGGAGGFWKIWNPFFQVYSDLSTAAGA
jgi:hypothetical protein